MRIEIAQIASGLLRQRRDEFLHDASLPLPVRGMINVHFDSSWIPDFWSVAIRTPKPGSEGTSPPTLNQSTPPSTPNQGYFDFPIGFAEDGTSWFFPSRQWWLAHAQVSHAPSGMGCDADVHTKFLSSKGSVHEFDYATVFLDGRLTILGRADFVEECMFWTRAFGTQKETP